MIILLKKIKGADSHKQAAEPMNKVFSPSHHLEGLRKDLWMNKLTLKGMETYTSSGKAVPLWWSFLKTRITKSTFEQSRSIQIYHAGFPELLHTDLCQQVKLYPWEQNSPGLVWFYSWP